MPVSTKLTEDAIKFLVEGAERGGIKQLHEFANPDKAASIGRIMAGVERKQFLKSGELLDTINGVNIFGYFDAPGRLTAPEVKQRLHERAGRIIESIRQPVQDLTTEFPGQVAPLRRINLVDHFQGIDRLHNPIHLKSSFDFSGVPAAADLSGIHMSVNLLPDGDDLFSFGKPTSITNGIRSHIGTTSRPADIFEHEYGHVLHKGMQQRIRLSGRLGNPSEVILGMPTEMSSAWGRVLGRENLVRDMVKPTPEILDHFARTISRYGATSGGELFAETFAGIRANLVRDPEDVFMNQLRQISGGTTPPAATTRGVPPRPPTPPAPGPIPQLRRLPAPPRQKSSGSHGKTLSSFFRPQGFKDLG